MSDKDQGERDLNPSAENVSEFPVDPTNDRPKQTNIMSRVIPVCSVPSWYRYSIPLILCDEIESAEKVNWPQTLRLHGTAQFINTHGE